MRKTFSFTGSPIQSVLERAHETLPGIEKVLAIFYDEQQYNIRALISQKNNQGIFINEVDKIEEIHTIDEMRSVSNPMSWVKKDDIPFDIPFDISATKQNAITMFDELHNTILILRFKNEHDGRQDLLFYYFNSDTSNFGISRDSRELTTEHKGMISHMLYHFVKSLIVEHKENYQQLLNINKNTLNALNQIKSLKSKLNEKNSRYRKSVSDLCLQYAKDISIELKIILKISHDALEKLIDYNGDINNLRSIIEQAAIFAKTINTGYTAGEVIIEDMHINFDFEDLKPVYEYNKVNVSIREERYHKTRQILDEIESAAKTLHSRGVKLTSSNLADSLVKPKTAAAISDQLKQHKDRILTLFEEYPKNWDLIRKEFRPIQNIVNH